MAGIDHNAIRPMANLEIGSGRSGGLISQGEQNALCAPYFSAEYWERLWIVQEIVSAKEIVFFIILVGNMPLAFGQLESSRTSQRHRDLAELVHETDQWRGPRLQFSRGKDADGLWRLEELHRWVLPPESTLLPLEWLFVGRNYLSSM